MKIVIATAVYYPMINGVATFSHNLAVGLAGRGHEVLVLTPSQTGRSYTRTVEGVKVAYLKSTTVRIYPDQIHKVPKKRKVLGREWPRLFYKHGFKVSVFPAREIKRVLDKFQPDVVHVQVSDPIGLSCVSYARAHHVPVVTTEHNQPEVITEPLGVPAMVRKPVNGLLAAYFANRQSKSDYVTMPTKQAIEKLFANGRELAVPVEAVSNGVDLAHFAPGAVSAEFYQKYHLNPEALTVLYVGRVDPEKNVGAVVEAYKLTRAKLFNVPMQLLVVGDGVDRVRCEALASGLADVHFVGRVVGPELYDFYRAGDVFMTASEIETQGIVLIEAAACGLPLIAVKAGAVAEICVNNENGFLCQPRNVGEMAEALTRLLQDSKLREKFSARSVELAGEHNFEKTLDSFERIYQKVIGDKTL